LAEIGFFAMASGPNIGRPLLFYWKLKRAGYGGKEFPEQYLNLLLVRKIHHTHTDINIGRLFSGLYDIHFYYLICKMLYSLAKSYSAVSPQTQSIKISTSLSKGRYII